MSRLLVVRVPAYVKVMSKSESTALVVVSVICRVLVASTALVVQHLVDMKVLQVFVMCLSSSVYC